MMTIRDENRRVLEALRALAIPPYADDQERSASFAREMLNAIVERDARRLVPKQAKDKQHPRRGMRSNGAAHPTDDHIGRIIIKMLQSCVDLKAVPAADLVRLVTYRLFGHAEPSKVRPPYGKPEPYERPAFVAAVNYELAHPNASARAIADAVGVDHKTVLTWRKTRTWINLFGES